MCSGGHRTAWIRAAVVLLALLAGASPADAARRHRALAPARPLEYVEIVTGPPVADGAPLPLVIALHGRGHTPASFVRELRRLDVSARVVIPRGPLRQGKGRAWFGPRARSADPERLAAAASHAADQVGDLVDAVTATHPTCGKPLVVGYSQGGIVAFTLAVQRPDRIGRVVAVAATLPAPLLPDRLRPAAPIVALHGIDDARVPFTGTDHLVGTLRATGHDAEMHAYDRTAHEMSPRMRRDLLRIVSSEVDELGNGCR